MKMRMAKKFSSTEPSLDLGMGVDEYIKTRLDNGKRSTGLLLAAITYLRSHGEDGINHGTRAGLSKRKTLRSTDLCELQGGGE
jgi:hypothetical protein